MTFCDVCPQASESQQMLLSERKDIYEKFLAYRLDHFFRRLPSTCVKAMVVYPITNSTSVLRNTKTFESKRYLILYIL